MIIDKNKKKRENFFFYVWYREIAFLGLNTVTEKFIFGINDVGKG